MSNDTEHLGYVAGRGRLMNDSNRLAIATAQALGWSAGPTRPMRAVAADQGWIEARGTPSLSPGNCSTLANLAIAALKLYRRELHSPPSSQ
jgi:hypothetical protein